MRRRVPCGVAVLVALFAMGDTSSGRARACVVKARPQLCRAVAALRRPQTRADRVPRRFRDDQPFPQLELRSSRRLSDRNGREVFVVGGTKYVCLLDYLPKEHGGSYVCNYVGRAVAGQIWEETACDPRRPHRVLVLQLLPDGVRYAAIRRVGKPALRFPVRSNLLLADLRVRSRGYLPKQTVWRRRGVLHRIGVGHDDSLFTCRGG
jgi:hypothetical protein